MLESSRFAPLCVIFLQILSRFAAKNAMISSKQNSRGEDTMERTDFYLLSTRSGKVKEVLAATPDNLRKAKRILQKTNGRLLNGNLVLTKEDVASPAGEFVILVNGHLKDKVTDFDEAQENAHTYQMALEALDSAGTVQIIQVQHNQAKRRLGHSPLEELDELTLKRFHMNRKNQQNCEFCQPSYPAQPYQDFNFCPHCGRYLH